jgi:hypothetical protein
MKMSQLRLNGIRACVFDAYGTLFDVNSAAEQAKDALGERWQALADNWRAKQLQYTWLKGRYAIYAFPAFLPVLAAAHRAFRIGDIASGRKALVLVVAAAALLLQIVPDSILYYGIGMIGPILLWIFLLRSSAVGARENHAA